MVTVGCKSNLIENIEQTQTPSIPQMVKCFVWFPMEHCDFATLRALRETNSRQ